MKKRKKNERLDLPEEDIDDEEEEHGDDDSSGPFPVETNVWIGPFVWINRCPLWSSTSKCCFLNSFF